MSTAMMSAKPQIELTRGTSETFFNEEPLSTHSINVPSCRPTPLIGTWADESWPLNSRQASEIITEQVLNKQCSSTLFEDDNGNILMAHTENYVGDRSSSCPDDQETVNESMMMEAMSHAQNTEYEVQSLTSIDSCAAHVAQSYMFDPYSISNAQTIMFRCTCDVCFTTLQQNDFHNRPQTPTPPTVPSAPNAVDNFSPVRSHTHTAPTPSAHSSDWNMPTYQLNSYPRPKRQQPLEASTAVAPQQHQFPTAPKQSLAAPSSFATHTHSPGQQLSIINSATNSSSPSVEVTRFMPPPPPPRIATMVFEEEKTIHNPSGIYYHLFMRWFKKVQECQEYFVRDQDFCPAPNKDLYSFEQWADEVSGWWYTNFEHMQKKYTHRW